MRYTSTSCFAGVVAMASLLLASCGTAPTAAPVIERSPNAGPVGKKTAPATTAAAPAPAPAPSTGTPAGPAPGESPSATGAAVTKPVPAATASPAPAPLPPVAVAPAKSDKQPAAATEKPAAAEEPTTKPYREGDWRPEYHVVKKGDTLYSIALDYGQDYREIAAWNNLEDPGLIKIDQRLRLFPPDSVGEATTVQPTALAAPAPIPALSEPKARKVPYSEQALAQFKMAVPAATVTAAPTAGTVTTGKPSPKPQVAEATPPPSTQKETVADGRMIWEWPAQGKLLYGFGQGPIQKGIGIEGHSGQPVMAAAPGKVVYSGSGLRGYGKLIIVKHNASYLSVYAHNSRVLVKEGQTVAKGQKIAEIGDSDSDRIVLHFEIRRLGKPIDPLQYLPERS